MAKTRKIVTKTKRESKACAAERPAPESGAVSEAITGSCTIVTVDRRCGSERRKGADRRTSNVPVAVERRKLERRAKVNRRRQIDPTTCERDYSHDEIEFMNALDQYKRTSGRMFPTCSEILEVIRKLGYEKRSLVATPESPSETAQARGPDQATPPF